MMLFVEKHILPKTDIRFVLCLVLSCLVPNSTHVDMLKPRYTEQQSGVHVPHHMAVHHHHLPRKASNRLKQLAFLGTSGTAFTHQLY